MKFSFLLKNLFVALLVMTTFNPDSAVAMDSERQDATLQGSRVLRSSRVQGGEGSLNV
jgi:hypothetical protein